MKARFACLLMFAAAAPAAAQFPIEDFSVTACGRAEPLFRSGLEPGESADSHASGGRIPGDVGAVSFDIVVPDTGRTHTVLLQVPAGYDPARPAPLVVALHGSAPSPPAAAAAIRTLWQPTADLQGAIVIAPIASGNNGGWLPDFDTPAIACAIAETERRYDVDRARRYLWGFSAGAHYGHALALANSTRFAAYAVNAGALFAFACGQPGTASSCESLLPTVARRIPVQLRVGTNDTLEPYTDGDELRLEAAGWVVGEDLKKLKFVGGHTIGPADPQHAWAWFAPRRLPD